MDFYSDPRNATRFIPTSNHGTYYGLLKDVRYCKKCVISNQWPRSSLQYLDHIGSIKSTVPVGDDFVCSACEATEEVETEIDWEERDKELRALCDQYRKSDGSYDCLVPGSGGKDSMYAALKLKYEYGMNPLTATWSPHLYTPWGLANFEAWINSGFPNVLVSPNGRVRRALSRLATENLLHPFQPFGLGQFNFPAKIAVQHKIPLVFYGETTAEYGNPKEDLYEARCRFQYIDEHSDDDIYLGGVQISKLVNEMGFNRYDLDPYLPMNPDIIEENNIETHFLGYYLPWRPQKSFYFASEHGNFRPSPERTAGTYTKFNSIDDKMDDLFYFTIFIKFGLGRASWDAAIDTRYGEITRDEALLLVKKYDGEWPSRFMPELFEYLSLPAEEYPELSKFFEVPVIDEDYFSALCDQFRSPHLWVKSAENWELRDPISKASIEKTAGLDWVGNR